MTDDPRDPAAPSGAAASGEGLSPDPAAAPAMRCASCDVALETGSVTVGYLGNAFEVELLRCPRCGQAFVPEDIAMGKMAEVEQTLEDK